MHRSGCYYQIAFNTVAAFFVQEQKLLRVDVNKQWKFAYFCAALTFWALSEGGISIGIQKKIVSPSLGLYAIQLNHPCTKTLRFS